jgi:deazaflavin-dependent oxidoreductase (nitroreductase family)
MFRVPLHLQRVGLGGWERLLGIRFIKISTEGRRTGKPHSVLVDILERDETDDVYYVHSAFGESADWVRNIEANPVFEAQVRGKKFEAVAERVDRSRAAEILMRYIENHKRYSKMMMRSIGVDLDDFTDEELRLKLEDELVLAIRPAS